MKSRDCQIGLNIISLHILLTSSLFQYKIHIGKGKRTDKRQILPKITKESQSSYIDIRQSRFHNKEYYQR